MSSEREPTGEKDDSTTIKPEMITISLHINHKPYQEYSVNQKGNLRDQVKLLVQDIKARYPKHIQENEWEVWLKIESRMNGKTTSKVLA